MNFEKRENRSKSAHPRKQHARKKKRENMLNLKDCEAMLLFSSLYFSLVFYFMKSFHLSHKKKLSFPNIVYFNAVKMDRYDMISYFKNMKVTKTTTKTTTTKSTMFKMNRNMCYERERERARVSKDVLFFAYLCYI